MNYFELFEIPVSLKVNRGQLRKKYFELSRQHHPDYFVKNSPEEQQNAEEFSALLNRALKTLSSQDETIIYLLELKGLIKDNEKYQLPPDFLMQVMEVNEELHEMKATSDPNRLIRIRQQLTELEKELYEPVKEIIENYREGATSPKELLQVKDYYFKKKYLRRLQQQLEGKL